MNGPSRRFGRLQILLLVTPLTLAACNPLAPTACTLIACAGTFIVEVTGAPAGTPVTVVATAPDGTSKTAQCLSSATACTAFIDAFMPATATVRVLWNSRTAEFAVTPTYVTSYPNGPNCPPACVQARIAITIPL
jgi:hypothetical protein